MGSILTGFLFSLARGVRLITSHAKARETFGEILKKGFRVVCISKEMRVARGGGRLNLVKLEFARYLFNDFRLDWPLLLDVGINKRMFAEEIDHARDAKRVHMRSFNGLRTENWFPVRSADAESFSNVGVGLLLGKRRCFATQHDSLAELPQLREVQLIIQLGLTGENYLEQFFGRSLKVCQQTNLLQNWRCKILSFVDNEHGGFACAIPLHQ